MSRQVDPSMPYGPRTGGGATVLGDNSNYSYFDPRGHQSMAGDAIPWDDLRIEPVARTTGARSPAFERCRGDGGASIGVFAYSFDDAVAGSEKEVYFSMQMPHSWDSSSVNIHVHWIASASQNAAAPRWGLEYTWADAGVAYPVTLFMYSDGINYTASGTSANLVVNTHYISKFSALAPGAGASNISSILLGRLFRDSANVADTYTTAGNKCCLLYIDAHFQINSIGSSLEYVK